MARKSKIEKARIIYNDRVKSILPERCVLNGGPCSLNSDDLRRDELVKKQPYAFIMRPYRRDTVDMENACKNIIEKKNLEYYVARNAIPPSTDGGPTRTEIATIQAKDESFIGHGYCQICSLCLFSYFGVAELGWLNPNVLLECGLMFAFSKPVVFTLDTRLTSIDDVPFDVNGILLVVYESYEELIKGLENKVLAALTELKGRNLLK